jgi:hypothetical protein
MISQITETVSEVGEEKSIYKLYKFFSLLLSLVFAVVGLTFLFMADGVLIFFNAISEYLGMPTSSSQGTTFYFILAVGYMYLVTLLAYLMYRHPENKYFLWLLIHAKTASSILSILLFLLHQQYLIYITNALVDGSIAGVLVLFYLKLRKVRV